MNDKTSNVDDDRWNEGDELPPLPQAVSMPAVAAPAIVGLAGDTDGPAISNQATKVAAPAPRKPGLTGEILPRRLGNYELLELIDRGGMGVVYKARSSGPVQRIVAIKIIRPEIGGSEILARFRTECQSLAMMNHPNIATIFEVGATDHGEPYLVMELVEGTSLTEYCLAATETLAAKLELFCKVCAGVQHAHQKRILHRDLKPSNVLVCRVDGSDVPKIIDFGLAKVESSAESVVEASQSSHTKLGQILGTLHYMSPEAANLRPETLDTRSDVFSLGVILFELLTGSPPLNEKLSSQLPIDERLRRVRNQQPVRPSTHCSDKSLRGDLDAICCKALATNPDDRYESATALAADLQRYLDLQPVSATQISTTYLITKFARRNYKVLIGFGAATALLIGLTGTSIAWAIKANRAETRAEDQLAITLLAKEAEQAALVTAELERETAERINFFLRNDLLAQASPDRTSSREITIREVVDQAAISLKDRFLDKPVVKGELLTTIAEVYMDLGEADNAQQYWLEGYELLRTNLGANHFKTLNANQGIAQNLLWLGSYREAEQRIRSNFDYFRKAGESSVDERRSVQNDLAVALNKMGRKQEGCDLLLDLIQESEPITDKQFMSLASYKSNLAADYTDQSRNHEAYPLTQDAVEIATRIMGLDHPATLTYRSNFAHCLMKLRKLDQAYQEFKKLREASDRTLGSNHPDSISIVANLAGCLRLMGKLKEAETEIQEALEAQRESSSQFSPVSLNLVRTLADVKRDQGLANEAFDVLHVLAKTLIDERGVDNRMAIVALSNAAQHLNKMGDYDRARSLINQYWRYSNENFEDPPVINEFPLVRCWILAIKGLDDWDRLAKASQLLLLNTTDSTASWRKERAWLRYQAGYALAMLKQHDRAVELLRESYEIELDLQGRFYHETLDAQIMLASVLRKLARWDEAERLLHDVIDVYSSALDPKSNRCSKAVDFLNDVAEGYRDEDQFDRANHVHEFLVEFCRARLGDDHEQTLSSLNGWGRTLNAAGATEEAGGLYRTALERAGPSTEANRNKHAIILYNWGLASNRLDRWDETVEVWERAARVSKECYGETYYRAERAAIYQCEALVKAGRSTEARPLLDQLTTIDETSDTRNWKYKIDAIQMLEEMIGVDECEAFATKIADLFKRSLTFDQMDIWQRTGLALAAARAYRRAGLLDKSLALNQAAHKQRQASDPEYYQTATAARELGETLFLEGDQAAAEQMWEQAQSIYKGENSRLSPKSTLPQKLIDRIAELYNGNDQNEQAEVWRAKD